MSSQFQFVSTIQFVSVNGQVASSHPRTACACPFILVISQVASSHPRTACAYQFSLVISRVASSYPRTACTCQFVFILVIGQAASSNPRTACTCALFLPSAKWLVQIQEQLVLPTYSFSQVTSSDTRAACAFSTCQCSRSSSQFEPKERLAPANLLFSLPSESCYSVNVYQSRNGYDILCFCYSVNVYQSRNGYDILRFCYFVNVYQSRNGYDIFC